ncbi:MAG: hypothetical protein C0467_08740 [Planctomycetaceae bacterium]|nr:hypothetical protein [Planctomycetaceae bacterium]
MVEQELGAVQQHPEHVGQRFLLVVGRATAIDVARELLQFLGARVACERGHEQGRDSLLRVPSRHIHDRAENLALLDARDVRDELAVHQHQGLEDRRVRFRRLLVRGEAVQERTSRVVRLLVEVELVLPHEAGLAVAGRGDHRVEQLGGGQPLQAHLGETLRVGLARVRHLARQLIRLRPGDPSHQGAIVELGIDERLAEIFEQLRVARRVVVARLVNGVLNPEAEEVCPHPVHRVLGEVRVCWVGEPCREFLAR